MLTATWPRALPWPTSAASTASRRTPTTAGGNSMPPLRLMTRVISAPSKPRSDASNSLSPSCCSTSRCSRRSPKKSGDRPPAACRRGLPPKEVSGLRTACQSGSGPAPLDAALSPACACPGEAFAEGNLPAGAEAPAVGLPAHSRALGAERLAGQPQACPSALAGTGLAAACPSAKAQETGEEAGNERPQLREPTGPVQGRCVDL